MKFTTTDQDNDNCSCNCATDYNGPGWYNYCNHGSNLNGLNYEPSESVKAWNGISWRGFGGAYISLKSVQMTIRPMN